MIITVNDTANQILTIVDSNWGSDFIIKRHVMTYDQFRKYASWTGNAYTVYNIGNSSIPTQ